MQFRPIGLLIATFSLAIGAAAQTTFIQPGGNEYRLIERLEIKAKTDSVLNFSKTRPYPSRSFIPAIGNYLAVGDSVTPMQRLSRVDAHNLRQTLTDYEEHAHAGVNYNNAKPIGRFYQNPVHLYRVKTPDFFLVVDPVIQYTVAKESDNDQHLFLNTRGARLRGNIMNRVSFAAYLTDNQERQPRYVQDFTTARQAVPGAGYYKEFKDAGGVDYFDARGYVSFSAAKVIDITFGYDKNFIGNGQRSLLLSDFSQAATFLKINTRIWKFNYQNLFMELNQAYRRGGDRLLPRKYAAIHHLDLAITKWLNVGLFEGIVFGRSNRFDFGYLNPVIFYRSAEQQGGSFDNALAGLDVKANVAQKFQFYGQLMLDEFKLAEVRAGDGWWGNKFAGQIGGKYIDAFGIPNLDLQAEYNAVRPFTYAHRDSVANYTHYNQPLAHPLGANFREVLIQARYQPAPRWTVQARAMYYNQGVDTNAESNGSNIFLPNEAPFRTKDYGFEIGSGAANKVAMGNVLVSYEIRPNLFLELNGMYRRQSKISAAQPERNAFVMSGGVRWNVWRRDFDF